MTINTKNGQVQFEGYPNKCPFCHKAITPNFIYGLKRGRNLEIFLSCPNLECNRGFIGYYELRDMFRFTGQVTQGTLVEKNFSETITNISNSFETIYNQAYIAEQQNLSEICGVGYRKALEFLIKDYAIYNMPENKDIIEKKLLASCISEYVDDTRVKSVAKRAVWLGNDETHYIRKWEGKNLDDLKKLIELTVHWLEMEALTKGFESEMPD